MGVKWIQTKYPGVRYYEHSTRKHGLQKDRYFTIRFQGEKDTETGKRKQKEEGLGWASEGMTAEKAAGELGKLKEAHRVGAGPITLGEKREIEADRRQQEEKGKERQKLENVTFAEYYRDSYAPAAKTHKKANTILNESGHVSLWIVPVVGDKPFKSISALDIERIKKKLLEAKKSPRTLQYVMATFRQVWNMARRDGLVASDSPTRSVKLPKVDNKRERFLSHDEADKLLEALKARCLDTYRMAAISLYTGMRRGEIFNLEWRDVDTDKGFVRIMDPKAKRTQYVYMNDTAKAIFTDMTAGKPEDLLFSTVTGVMRTETPETFNDVVKELEFNKGITDERHKVFFHTLRHTFASWLVLEGVDLYRVQKLMRHLTSAMTQRYAHLAPDTLQSAVNAIDRKPEAAGEKKAEGK